MAQSWRLIDLTGKRFGRLKVTGRAATPYGTGCGQAFWNCVCDCGEGITERGQNLRSGLRKSCGCGHRTLITVGARVGKLVVLGFLGVGKNRASQWKCLCDCGQECVKNGSYLKRQTAKSCGCLQRRNPGKAAENAVYCAYRTMAKFRGLTFSLTKEQAAVLFRGVCWYCGVEPQQQSRPHRYTNGAFRYNGIDRVDNDKGYVPGNLVSCCGVCNLAKRGMRYNAFVEWCWRIAQWFAGPMEDCRHRVPMPDPQVPRNQQWAGTGEGIVVR